MAQPLSIEHAEWIYFITTRTSSARLWLIKNKELEQKILGALARYQEIHQVTLYGFILMGNHYHLIAKFPNKNRALFMRDFNSAVARLVGRSIKEHGRRSVWARRYSYQILPTAQDVTHWFFYTSLNPVSTGLVKSVEQYGSYNSYRDARDGLKREYQWIDWSKYILAKRSHPKINPQTFATTYTLSFSRLPQHEDLSQQSYAQLLDEELQERQKELVYKRSQEGKGFLGVKGLKRQKIGDKPYHSKQSTRTSFRPLVLSLCSKAKAQCLSTYFSIQDAFILASKAFRAGNLSIIFPEGTYTPPRLIPA